MERWAEAIHFVWEIFSRLTLSWRLCLLLVLAAIAQYFVARIVAQRFAIRARVVGFSPSPSTQAVARKSAVRVLSVLVALAVAPGLAVALGWLQTNKLVIHAVRGEDGGARTLTVHASEIMADLVKISVPRNCKLKGEQNATMILFDPGSGLHSIEVKRFVAPANVTIGCENDGRLQKRNFTIEKQPEGPYFWTELQTYQFRTYLAGGLTWLIGALFTFARFRSRSR